MSDAVEAVRQESDTQPQQAPASPFAAAAVVGESTSNQQKQAPMSPLMLGGHALATLVHALVLPKAVRLLAHALTAADPHAAAPPGWGRPACLLLVEVSGNAWVICTAWVSPTACCCL